MRVGVMSEAKIEPNALPPPERAAMQAAIEELIVFGDRLPFPHSSAVRGSGNLRELRPRASRSPWRAFYRRVGDDIVIGAVGPEANVDRTAFRRAIDAATSRVSGLEEECT